MKSKIYTYALFSVYVLTSHPVAEWMILFLYPECSYKPYRTLACSLHQEFMGKNHYAGVYASYAGHLALSDDSGQIRFARKHQKNSMMVLVVQKIRPIFVSGKTINHFEVDITSQYAFYSLEQKVDLHTGKKYWETSLATLPATRIIPYDTLILFAKPNHIRIPVGKSSFINGSQLLLPKMYVSDSVTNDLNVMQVLAIRQFFAPLVPIYQIGVQEVIVHMSE